MSTCLSPPMLILLALYCSVLSVTSALFYFGLGFFTSDLIAGLLLLSQSYCSLMFPNSIFARVGAFQQIPKVLLLSHFFPNSIFARVGAFQQILKGDIEISLSHISCFISVCLSVRSSLCRRLHLLKSFHIILSSPY